MLIDLNLEMKNSTAWKKTIRAMQQNDIWDVNGCVLFFSSFFSSPSHSGLKTRAEKAPWIFSTLGVAWEGTTSSSCEWGKRVNWESTGEPSRENWIPRVECLRMKRQPSEGCDVDNPQSESDEDMTTSQGAPAPGQCSLLSEEDQTLPQPSSTIRILGNCRRKPPSPSQPHCRGNIFQNPIFLQERSTFPRGKGKSS